jgi:methionyl-tRNA formyltransferase
MAHKNNKSSDNHHLRVVFVGAVEEGRECLHALLEYGANVVGIFTFTDAIAAKTSGAVDFTEIADQHNIPLYKVKSTNTPEAVEMFRALAPDVIFVVGWTRLVSSEILQIPKYGCFGMHASLLPKYRGRAPVNWAIIHNEKLSGNTAMLLNEGVDTGQVVAQKAFPISLADTCQTVYHKVAAAGKEMAVEILRAIENGNLQVLPQNDDEATEMPRRRPEDGLIDWHCDALTIFNFVRALTHPYPGAFSYLNEKTVFIWEARIAHYPYLNKPVFEFESLEPGTVIDVADGILVKTGNHELISLHRLQAAGEDEVDWQTFVSRYHIQPGDVFRAQLETLPQNITEIQQS